MISVILPTVRQELYFKTLVAIDKAASGVEYETIVVADFEYGASMLPSPVKWIYAPERKGVVDANIKGYAASSGDYIMTLSDEATLYPGSLFALKEFCKYFDNKILTSPTHIPYFGFYYYKKWFAPFPFAHRSLIEACGGLFLPEYKCFYADPDLSLRAYEKGFKVLECVGASIHHPNDMSCEAHKYNVSAYVEADRLTFKTRWAHLGEFKDP